MAGLWKNNSSEGYMSGINPRAWLHQNRERGQKTGSDHGGCISPSLHHSWPDALVSSDFVNILDSLVFSRIKADKVAIIFPDASSSSLECPNTGVWPVAWRNFISGPV
ncbi:hypothetical protein CesoFtcFv8_002385 [Champsocephalus esox]|uniref:Uncharacterized protein n=1 Tax=Champsocephalus esox TaxID=159716 RepID=A0AAN8D4F2_9TELE|nr:hypothetical protein CesoFtcFv8_002385 [Champsocephalus esox]